MAFEQAVVPLDEFTVLAECGPMRLTIQAAQNGQPQMETARQAAAAALTFLERVAAWRPDLSRPHGQLLDRFPDELADRMLGSVRAVGDPDLTPMAAVAGTIADAVADWLLERGMTRVVVDNGGDIAIRLAGDEQVRVGLRSEMARPGISHVIELDARQPIWGVATSGVGGRSLTRGIASAATVVAGRAGQADAAATAIANACWVADPSINQVPARQMDPHTDLGELPVTLRVGPLSPERAATALEKSLARADALCHQGMIRGALVFCCQQFRMTSGLKRLTTNHMKL
jgi:uncharacterized protein